ncbi:hypothetical protein R1sor_007333 [Riccia sorocarpa]|uniref:Uncharacterized protein n=1 Tax=Riccia sorocarpa TaxID=122646 RepID=A0ABD3HT36_9MARC
MAERLSNETHIVRHQTHVTPLDSVLETCLVTPLHSSGLRPSPVSVGDTIQIPSRRGPLSISGDAVVTYRSCNNTYWGVPASIPVREVVTVWGRRWIVKESTIPSTGLGIFALERVVVQPDTHPDDYPQLFPYVGSVYKRKQYKIMLRHVPHFIDDILDTSPNVPEVPQKRRYIDDDPVRTGNIAGYIQSSLGTNMIPNAEWHYVGTCHMWFHRRWNKGFHIMTGFDPPEVEAFFWRAQRRIQSIQATGVGVEDEDNAEDEVEDEVLEDVPEAYFPEEELQDQAILAEFFNMRYEPTSDTSKEHSSQLDEDACTPLFEGARLSKLTAILLLSNLQQKFNVSNSFMDSLYSLLAKQLLPENNMLPDSQQSARKMMTSVGLDYKMIHACPNDCYLYKPVPSANDPSVFVENTRTSCFVCGESRYISDTQGSTCPRKVLRWFPFIPLLLLTYMRFSSTFNSQSYYDIDFGALF